MEIKTEREKNRKMRLSCRTINLFVACFNPPTGHELWEGEAGVGWYP